MKTKICVILIVAFAALFCTSAYFIFDHYRQDKQQAELYDSLADTVDCAADTEEEPAEPVLYTEEKTVLPELAELYQQNGNLAGWIRIEDTNINYPVMHTPDENCDVQLPSDNVIIYGHHMKNGSMFCDLEKFKSQDFWQEHKTFLFSTVTDRYEYEIVSVFKTFVYSDSPESFKYYHFVNAQTPEDFSAFIDRCKELSLYETGVSAEYGDKLITLSTCEYSRTNGRLVVVAKRISN